MDNQAQQIYSKNLALAEKAKKHIKLAGDEELNEWMNSLINSLEWAIENPSIPTMSEMVREFHKKQGLGACYLDEFSSEVCNSFIHDRFLVMQEEWHEVTKALLCEAQEEIAQELADLMYTIVGTAITFGIEIEPVFAEVHRCNMLKGPGFDKTNYTKPEIKV